VVNLFNALSDADHATIQDAAAALPPDFRCAFLTAVGHRLAALPTLSDHDVEQAIQAVLDRFALIK